jgi:hypothetical protein
MENYFPQVSAFSITNGVRPPLIQSQQILGVDTVSNPQPQNLLYPELDNMRLDIFD